jgi:hypothetical protein
MVRNGAMARQKTGKRLMLRWAGFFWLEFFVCFLFQE